MGALAVVGCGGDAATDSTTIDVAPLPPIAPADCAYGKGVSALAAGEIDGTLIAAGGANFADKPAAEGGAKCFYDEIYALENGAGEWTLAGSLPRPTAYGAAFTTADGVIVAGGANATGTLADVMKLTITRHALPEDADGCDGIQAVVTELPPLPIPVEQAGAAQCGAKLYIAGGLTNGAPSLGVYTCDLAGDGKWRMTAELPEVLVQPIAAATERCLYVWGGFGPVTKSAADYGFRLDLESREWSRIEGLPDGGTAVGSTAVQDADGVMWVVGGVNREVFNAALNMPADKSAEYLSQPVDYYRFRREVFSFDPATEEWSSAGETPAAARAGAGVVLSPTYGLVVLDGEEKPGIRSAEVTKLEFFN